MPAVNPAMREGLAPLDMAKKLLNWGGSSMQAMTRSLPPHSGQVSMSMANTRLKRCIRVRGMSNDPLGSEAAFSLSCTLTTASKRQAKLI